MLLCLTETNNFIIVFHLCNTMRCPLQKKSELNVDVSALTNFTVLPCTLTH